MLGISDNSSDPHLRRILAKINLIRIGKIITRSCNFLICVDSKVGEIYRDLNIYSYSIKILPIVVVVLLANNLLTPVETSYASNILTTPPEKIPSLIEEVGYFTPTIDEDIATIAESTGIESDPYIAKQAVGKTINSPFSYTVAKGDTIGSIASKNNLNVATVLEANDLKSSDIDKIKPGTTLVIPPYKTSDSTAWLDEVNRKKEEERKLAEATRLKREAEDAKKRALAARSVRTVAYRESSVSRSDGETPSSGGSFIVPINSKGITRGISGGHTGIDYRADIGTPVVAAKPGRVVEITGGWSGGWGNSVVIDHGGGVTTRYAHLSKPSASVGETVSQGDIIGYSGSSGFSTGPHLHFEERINGRVASPF